MSIRIFRSSYFASSRFLSLAGYYALFTVGMLSTAYGAFRLIRVSIVINVHSSAVLMNLRVSYFCRASLRRSKHVAHMVAQ